MNRRTLLAVGLVLIASDVRAQGSPSVLDRVSISGSLRAGHWSSTRDLDTTNPQVAGLAWLKATGDIAPGIAGFAEGWAALRGPPERTRSTATLREAYVDVRRGRLDARIGRQIIAWGRADGINPTDNLTPRDYTVLVADDHERRVGSTGVRASWYEGGASLTAIWLPEFQPHRVPLPRATGGPAMRELAARWPGETWALRAEQTGATVDWSVSFMRGPDLQPDLALGAGTGGPPTILLKHARTWVAGADAAMNIGRFGVRAEAAYTGTEDDVGTDPFVKNHHLFVVVGTDRNFTERLNVNVQYLERRIFNHVQAPADTTLASVIAYQGAIVSSQVAPVQHGATMRVRRTWHGETLAAELSSVAWFGPRGLVLGPKGTWAITDHWTTVVGGEIYRGDGRATLGMLRPNSVAYAEVRLLF